MTMLATTPAAKTPAEIADFVPFCVTSVMKTP
jgi:hypothetical protein